MKKFKDKYLLFLLIASSAVFTSCMKEPTNRGQVSDGIPAGVTYVKYSGDSATASSVITYKGTLVSQDGLKSVTAQLSEVLTIDAFGNPVSHGNKFLIGQSPIKNKEDVQLFDGALTVKYLGDKNFETGYKNKYSEYEVSGKIDLSKFRLLKGKRYRLSLNFITTYNMNALESPFMFVMKK